MTVIYRNFAKGFEELNQSVVGDRTTLVGGRRAYVVEDKPYFNNVHFSAVCECFFAHQILQRQFKENAELHNRIWAGTAGEVNLSYMAVSKAPAAVLFDINPFQILFWNAFFEKIAENPDPNQFAKISKKFIKDFYFDLSSRFNLQAIKKNNSGLLMSSPAPEDHMVSVEAVIRMRKEDNCVLGHKMRVDCSDVTKPGSPQDVNDLFSPIKNMRYKDFYEKIRAYLGWEETGCFSCDDEEVQWIANGELYAHLHLMAKNNAIAAVTLDVSDAQSCDQLRRCLDGAEYNTVRIVDGEDIESKPSQGARIGNMYLSNVLHYLYYSQDVMDRYRDAGKKLCDFSGKEVTERSFATTLDNLRALTSDDAYIVRFDRTGLDFMEKTDFKPQFSVGNYDDICIPRKHEPGGLVMP